MMTSTLSTGNALMPFLAHDVRSFSRRESPSRLKVIPATIFGGGISEARTVVIVTW